MDVFIGTIMPVAFNFAPRGWAMCNGQLLPISQNTALFALLGTMYGGNGVTTFGLPDLRGRALVGMGQGPGLTNVLQGQVWGNENVNVPVNGVAQVSIDAAHLPPHTHPVDIDGSAFTVSSTLKAVNAPGSATPTEGATLGTGGNGPGAANIYVSGNIPPNVSLNAGSVTTTLAGKANLDTGNNSGTGGTVPVPFSANAQAAVTQPSLGINYIIALQGIFPSHN